MTGNKKIVSGKRRRIRISHILILLLFIIVGAFIFFRLNTKRELNKRIKAIRSAGYPVTLEEVNQWYSIPDNVDNAANLFLDANSLYKQARNEENLPFFSKAELPSRTETMSYDMRNHISQYLVDNKESLKYLHKIEPFGYSRYPIDFSLGLDAKLPHLSEIKKCIYLLQLEAANFSEENDSNGTTGSIKSIISVSDSLSQEPTIISQLVRVAGLNRAVLALEYSMNRIEFSDEQLIELDKIFNKSQDFSGMKCAIVGERSMILSVFKNPLALSSDFSNGLPPKPVIAIYKVLGIVDKDAIAYLDFLEEFLNAYDFPVHEQINAFESIEVKVNDISGMHIFTNRFMLPYTRIVTINLMNIAELRITQAALAIERYRLVNKKLPDSLGNLVPDYLESVPLDPYDGKELRYKKLEKGFVVYSVGEDLIDDDGKERQKGSNRKSSDTWDITFIIEKTKKNVNFE